MIYRLLLTCLALICAKTSVAESASKADYLELARRGWNYELRNTMVGRDLSIPVHIHGKDIAEATLCIVGEAPHPKTRLVLDAFGALIEHSFGLPLRMIYGGARPAGCDAARVAILRLYSDGPPNGALSEDLHWLSDRFELGLPAERQFFASSPAMAQTFFGRKGQGTHIMVQQPSFETLSALEAAFYKSILVEELFQSFTFGMDVLIFDRSAGFLSKLQEMPTNLPRRPWTSRSFRRALLSSNPGGLCTFDLFMLHAVGRAPVEQTVHPAFLTYIDGEFDALTDLAQTTMNDPRFAPLVDPHCASPD
ncbi:MAG: hypothetical protein AAGA05_11500 [Pseudomonadota bacterium]